MAAREKIFHESWYRIASQRVCLRASVRIHRQMFRGEQWFVLHDPFTNNFYRFRPAVYEFIARLTKKKTVETVWNELLTLSPESAPSQGDIIELLAQLYQSNLLSSDLPPDSLRLFDRYNKREQKKVRMQMLNILFSRIPLFDPDRLLQAMLPAIRQIISPIGVVVWLIMIGLGLKTVIDNFGMVTQQSQGILAPSNLVLLYIGVVIIKLIHEFGHASVVRRFGGEVHTMGVMFLMLTPLPYMDATAAWAFRSKWKRILVGSGGMIFELFFAAIAIVVWANTGEGAIHSLAYNMAFSASVSSVVFNINPLLRYDGYYMLSDLVDTPNLQQQAQKQLTYVLEKYAFGRKDAISAATSSQEGFWYVVYSITSTIYRFITFSSIMLFISTKYLLLAVIMGLFMFSSWAIVPVVKLIKYLTTSPGLSRVRGKAIRVCSLTAIILLFFLAGVPFPFNFKAPGVLKAVGYQLVTTATPGAVQKVFVSSGSRVSAGDTLLVLDNNELREERKEITAAVAEVDIAIMQALNEHPADLEPLEKKKNALVEKQNSIDSRIDDLTVRASIGGAWIAPEVEDYIGRWFPRGTSLGQLVNSDTFYFLSVVPQQEIGQLFSRKVHLSKIRLAGQSGIEIPAKNMVIIPMERSQLPSSALGFKGGGDIPVAGDSAGVRTTEPFYEVRATVESVPQIALLHGRTGKMQFCLGYQPLLWQWIRKLRQLIQKHYQI